MKLYVVIMLAVALAVCVESKKPGKGLTAKIRRLLRPHVPMAMHKYICSMERSTGTGRQLARTKMCSADQCTLGPLEVGTGAKAVTLKFCDISKLTDKACNQDGNTCPFSKCIEIGQYKFCKKA